MKSKKQLMLSVLAAAAMAFGVGATLESSALAQVPMQKAPAKTSKVTLHLAGMT